MLHVSRQRVGYWTVAALTVSWLAAAAQPAAASVSFPRADVSISGGFFSYYGAVGNGAVNAPWNDNIWTSYMGDYPVAPSSPLPGGLASLYVPPDPNDPSSVGTGIGFGSADLGGAATVYYWTDQRDTSGNLIGNFALNQVAFTPGPTANVTYGEEFLLGTFTFTNGTWWAQYPVHEFGVQLTTVSADPNYNGHVFSDTLILNVTPNAIGSQPADLNADYYYFLNHPELGSVRVYENGEPGYSNTGTVELYGKIGSLDPTRFFNAQDGAFLDGSTGPDITPPSQLPTGSDTVPEPSTLLMFAAGLGAFAWRRRARA